MAQSQSTQTPFRQLSPPVTSLEWTLPSQPIVNCLELLTPFVEGLLQQARLGAREEYAKLLDEQAAAAAEADQAEIIDTVRSAAAVLGMREQSVYEWIKSNKLKSFKLGRAVRLKRGDVLAALKAQTQPDGRRKYARRATANKNAR